MPRSNPSTRPPCASEGCPRKAWRKGLCGRCYTKCRQAEHGHVEPIVPTLGPGRAMARGYIKVKRRGHPLAQCDGYVLEHRLVAWEHGVPPSDLDHVHHKDHDPANNDWSNLEVLPIPVHARVHWEIDRAEAVRLYQSGMTTTEVAAQLGTYAGNISRMIRSQGVTLRPKRRPQSVSHEAIRAMYEAGGVSKAEVARRMGCGAGLVYQVLKQYPSERLAAHRARLEAEGAA